MNFMGSQQTCYSDWARSVMTFYPEIKFKKMVAEQKVSVFVGNQEVAFFNFSDGTGYILDSTNRDGLSRMGRLPNFEQFDVDNMILV